MKHVCIQKTAVVFVKAEDNSSVWTYDSDCVSMNFNFSPSIPVCSLKTSFSRHNSPQWARASSLWSLQDHAQTHYIRWGSSGWVTTLASVQLFCVCFDFLLLRNRHSSFKQRLGYGVDNQNSISVWGRIHRVCAGSETRTTLWIKFPANTFSGGRLGQVFCAARTQRSL